MKPVYDPKRVITTGDLRSLHALPLQTAWVEARAHMNHVMLQGRAALPENDSEALLILLDLIQAERPAIERLINCNDFLDAEPVAPRLSAALTQIDDVGELSLCAAYVSGSTAPLNSIQLADLESRMYDDSDEEDDEDPYRPYGVDLDSVHEAMSGYLLALDAFTSPDSMTTLALLLQYCKAPNVAYEIREFTSTLHYELTQIATHNVMCEDSWYNDESQPRTTDTWPASAVHAQSRILPSKDTLHAAMRDREERLGHYFEAHTYAHPSTLLYTPVRLWTPLDSNNPYSDPDMRVDFLDLPAPDREDA